MARFWLKNPKWYLAVPIMIALVISVACGSDATPEPVVQEKVVTVEVIKEVQVTVEVIKEVQVTVEVPKEVIKEVVKNVEVTPTPTATPGPQSPPGLVMQSGPKVGGTFTYIWTAKPAHFDLQQSSTVGNLAPQGPMYNGLVRPNPLDGARSIGPDLAHSWRISADGLTYTFFLRDGVKFHDGAAFTAEDAVATWSRILNPPEGIVSIRKAFFNAVQSVEALDPSTVQFKLRFPAPVTLEGIAMEWNIIHRKKILEDNNFDLKRVQDAPGTGAFVFKDHIVGEKWVLAANADYWNEGLPYIDEFVMLHGSGSTRGPTILAGRADAGSSDPASKEIAREKGFQWQLYPGMLPWTILYNQSVKPFDDARVRKAIDLVLPRQVMQRAIAEKNGTVLGRWYPPVSVYAVSQEELLDNLAMKEDKGPAILEAKKLMKEAGFEDGFSGFTNKVRNLSYFIAHAEIIQAQLKRELNIDIEVQSVSNSVWNEVVRSGEFEMAQGSLRAGTFDPSEGFNVWYTCGGGENFGGWCNQEFDIVMGLVDREQDVVKRVALVREAMAILEREVPVSVFAYSGLHWIAWPYVKNMPDRSEGGPYTLLRWDDVWLDK